MLWCWGCAAAKLGSAGKFQGLHVIPDDGAGAMYVCSVLIACCDDKAVPPQAG